MRVWLTALIMAGVFAADQWSKRLIESRFEPFSTTPVLEKFNLVLIYNRGVSFGLLSSGDAYAPYVLALFGSIVTVALAVWAFRTGSPLQASALASISGGAASNVVDRLIDGAVTDFLDFHVGALHWPAFNLDDIAIVCGVGALLLESVLPATFRTKEHAP